MLPDTNNTTIKSPEARSTILLICAIIIPAILLRTNIPSAWHICIVYFLPVPALGLLASASLLMRKGAQRIASTKAVFTGGLVFIAGGTAFDITATLIHSPDLVYEANIVARLLLDTDHSVAFVYIYGGLMQAIVLCILVVLWAAFLKHRQEYLQASFENGQHSFMHFMKAATGGGRLSWRQWLIPLTIRELPSSYHLSIFLAPILLFASGINRWYLGLKWFELAPDSSDLLRAIVVIVPTGMVLVIWLRRKYSRLASEDTLEECVYPPESCP